MGIERYVTMGTLANASAVMDEQPQCVHVKDGMALLVTMQRNLAGGGAKL